MPTQQWLLVHSFISYSTLESLYLHLCYRIGENWSNFAMNYGKEGPSLEGHNFTGVGGGHSIPTIFPNNSSSSFPFIPQPDGSWICGFCCSLPPTCRKESSVWKAQVDGYSYAPTPSHISSHLQICPGTPVSGSTLPGLPVAGKTTTTRGYAGLPRAYIGTRMVVHLNGSNHRQVAANDVASAQQHSVASNKTLRLRKPTLYRCVSCGQRFDRWRPCIEHMRECCTDGQLEMVRSKRALRKKCCENWNDPLYQCSNCGQEWRKMARYTQHLKECYPQALSAYGASTSIDVENYYSGMQT